MDFLTLYFIFGNCQTNTIFIIDLYKLINLVLVNAFCVFILMKSLLYFLLCLYNLAGSLEVA